MTTTRAPTQSRSASPPCSSPTAAHRTCSALYGTSPTAGAPSTINAITGSTLTLNNNLGCAVGDVALIYDGPLCAAARVTGPTDIANPRGQRPTRHHECRARYSRNDHGSRPRCRRLLACLGTWNRVTYQVNNGNLEVNGVPTIAGIVNMQVQYGISNTASDNQVASWVNAEDDWVAPTVADRNRIKAIRIAVVARNSLWERDVVSTACSSTTDPAPTGVCAWAGSDDNPAPTVDLSAQADWNHYRYRVFETIIPLRNTIWSREQLYQSPDHLAAHHAQLGCTEPPARDGAIRRLNRHGCDGARRRRPCPLCRYRRR